MTQTVFERNRVYRAMLERITIIPIGWSSFCNLLAERPTYDNIENYPELIKRRPTDWDNCYWFPLDQDGLQKRIDLLKAAIEETEIEILNTIN